MSRRTTGAEIAVAVHELGGRRRPIEHRDKVSGAGAAALGDDPLASTEHRRIVRSHAMLTLVN
jgi:hypothetical protein